MTKVTFEISEDIYTREGSLRGSKGDLAGKNVLHALD
jgi:hypothetical protein